MAYTGTGTEADPYQVSTFQDFLTCIAKSSAYVKVVADINAKLEPDYNIVNNQFSFMCAKCYSDAQVTISGFKINITSTSNGAFLLNNSMTIQNIIFDDVVIVFATSNTNQTIFYDSSGRYAAGFTLDSCEFNILVESYSNAVKVIYEKCNLIDTILRVKFSKYETIGTNLTPVSALAGVKSERSVIEIMNYPLAYTQFTGTSITLNSFSKCEYTIIKFDTVMLYRGNLTTLINSYYATNNSIFVFGNGNHADDEKLKFTFGSNGISMCLADSDTLGDAYYDILDTQHVTLVTDEQLKSEDYLRSIGFIA